MSKRHPEWMEDRAILLYDNHRYPNAHRVARRLRVSVTWVLRVVKDNRRPVRRPGRHASDNDPAVRRHQRRFNARRTA